MIEMYSLIQPIFKEQLLCAMHIISGILEVHAVMNEIVQSREEKENKRLIILTNNFKMITIWESRYEGIIEGMEQMVT